MKYQHTISLCVDERRAAARAGTLSRATARKTRDSTLFALSRMHYLERVKGSLERVKNCPRFREHAQCALHSRHGRRAGTALRLDATHLVERLLRGEKVSIREVDT